VSKLPDSAETYCQLIIRPQIPVLHRGGYYTEIERELLGLGVHVVPVSVPSEGAGGAPCEIKGWYLKTNPKNPVVIYSHGIHASRGDLVPLAMELYRRGINAFLYDSRAHGMSRAPAITFGYHERHDMRRIIEKLEQSFEFRSVVLFGMSLGGAISLQSADASERIRGIVTAAAYWDMHACFRRYFDLMAPGGPPIEDILAIAARKAGFVLAETGPNNVVPNLKHHPPLLALHGGRDDLVEPRHARAIEENWPGPAELMIIEEAIHNDVLAYPRAFNRMVEFIESR
jgi:pimeloyl-ACP methyl ester carboxylesterase